MKKYLKSISFITVITVSLIFGVTQSFAQSDNANTSSDVPPGIEVAVNHVPVCKTALPGTARCHARIVVDPHGKPVSGGTPAAYGPADLRAAYNLKSFSGSSTQIIAIVDAYDDPTIQSDLNTYSATFGIPTLPPCVGSIVGSSVPCFKKIDQTGGTTYPAFNSSWAIEIALDVEIAHGICPNCSIMLVEGNSSNLGDLGTAVNTAVSQGATVVSNSYGTTGEFNGENGYDAFYNHPGVAITVSSGDSGYGTSYPAVSPYVTAVGGTSLYLSNGNYGSETAWNGAGSGCSSLETQKPLGQPTLKNCTSRIIADVSAVADPATGAAVYSSANGTGSWYKVGGTSLSSPLIAAVYALAGGVPAGVQGNSLPYATHSTKNMHDVTSGSSSSCPKVLASICTAIQGFDGPTGLGTPNGIGAF